MGTILSFLFTNPYLLSSLGCIAAAAIFYFKGKNSGLESAQERNREAMDQIETDLRRREAQNQNTETQRDQDAETVRRTSSIPMLISLFNKLFNQKAPDSSSDKKTD
jgi:hypothetical protein